MGRVPPSDRARRPCLHHRLTRSLARALHAALRAVPVDRRFPVRVSSCALRFTPCSGSSRPIHAPSRDALSGNAIARSGSWELCRCCEARCAADRLPSAIGVSMPWVVAAASTALPQRADGPLAGDLGRLNLTQSKTQLKDRTLTATRTESRRSVPLRLHGRVRDLPARSSG
jgi:hypothetical protein